MKLTRSQILAQAAQAAHVLESGIFDAIEADYMQRWRETTNDQTGQREMLWLSLNVLEDIKSKLKGQIDSGKIAKREIEIEAVKEQKTQ